MQFSSKKIARRRSEYRQHRPRGTQTRRFAAFAQPLHIHGHVWQVIGADPPAPFQDTVVVPAGEKVAVAFTADNPGLWALHSLVAERADGGLIGSFSVGG